MQFDAIRELVSSQLTRVDTLIIQNLESTVPLTQSISEHLISSGGKRIRPMVLLLASKGLNVADDKPVELSVILEYIHTATLLHDDVIDASSLRRGKKTANVIWGNAAPVLVGDFLYSRAFQMMVALKSFEILDILSEATTVIAEGEILQLSKQRCPSLEISEYYSIINAKTAKLFEVAALCAGVLAGCDKSAQLALKAYGKHIGIAFQLIDDALDYRVGSSVMGKNNGDDLVEGKMTLPLIHTYERAEPALKALIQKAVEDGDLTHQATITEAVIDTGALEQTMQEAQSHADQAKAALNALPSNTYIQGLRDLADFSVSRLK